MSVLPSKKLVFSIRSFSKPQNKECRETGKKKNLIFKTSLLLLAAFLLTVVPSIAQEEDYAPFEVFAGYNLIHYDVEGSGNDININGWNVAFTRNINSIYGIKIEVAGAYKSREVIGITIKDSIHSFMAGPQFGTQLNEHVRVFEHVLVGFTKDKWSAMAVGLSGEDNCFSMTFGGGLDWKIADNLAIRAPQFDYYVVKGDSRWYNNIRVSAGIVFKFGK